MEPQVDDYTIKIPSAFDQQRGRVDKKSGKIIVSCVLVVFFIIIVIGTLRSDDKSVLSKVAMILGSGIAIQAWLRFATFKELTFSDAFESLKERDFVPRIKSYWSIYAVDDRFPYICHYKSGIKGIFVAFVKDVVVGKPDTIMFDHYDAIGRAYQAVGSLPIKIRHIDYMNSLGDDDRLIGLFNSLEDCDNPDLNDLLFQIYDNLGYQMSQDYASFDVYLFTGNLSDINLWYNVKRVLDIMITSNYLSYKVLNAKAIEDLTKVVFNLSSFNIREACENVFASDDYSGIVPIRIIKADGTEIKLNDTMEEKAEKARLRKEEEERKKAEWKALSFKEKLSKRFSILINFFKVIKLGVSSKLERSQNNDGAINNTDLATIRVKTNLQASEELKIIAENELIEQELREQAKAKRKEVHNNSSNIEDVDLFNIQDDNLEGEDFTKDSEDNDLNIL